MKKAVQLHTIRALASRDLEAALKTVSQIGYEGVEFAGFFGHSAQEVSQWLRQYNLEAVSAHVAEELIFAHTEETIAYHKEIGNHNIVCPWSDLKTRADTVALAEKFKAVSKAYREAGMTPGYHNHAHEFQKDQGEYLIDILAQEAPKDVLQLQFDIYWVYRGGESPVAYMKKYADRISLFHLKDGDETNGTLLSQGNVDLEGVLSLAKSLHLPWAIVESEAMEGEAEQIEAITKDYAVLDRLSGSDMSRRQMS